MLDGPLLRQQIIPGRSLLRNEVVPGGPLLVVVERLITGGGAGNAVPVFLFLVKVCVLKWDRGIFQGPKVLLAPWFVFLVGPPLLDEDLARTVALNDLHELLLKDQVLKL